MGGLYGFAAGQIGDGAGNFQYAVIGASREVESGHGRAQQGESGLVGSGVCVEQSAVHLCIVIYAGCLFEAFALYFPGADYPFANGRAGFSRTAVGDFLERNGNDFYLYVDTVEQRTRDAVQVTVYRSGRADTFFLGVVVISARAGIHRSDKHDACRVFDGVFCPCDSDFPVFEGLAHDFEYLTGELGQFVEEKHAVVGQRYFTRLGKGAATYEGCARYGMVRCPERPLGEQ